MMHTYCVVPVWLQDCSNAISAAHGPALPPPAVGVLYPVTAAWHLATFVSVVTEKIPSNDVQTAPRVVWAAACQLCCCKCQKVPAPKFQQPDSKRLGKVEEQH
jgi:hypothetical protein